MKKNLQTAFTRRQYMVSKDFEIYYYNDRNMTSVENHTHTYYEYYFFLGGDVSIEIDGSSQILAPGDVIIIPPGTNHHLDILDPDAPYQRFIFWLSESFLQDLIALDPDYGYLVDHVATTRRFIYHFDRFSFNALQSKVLNLIEELHSERFGKNARVALDVSDLVFSVNRLVHEMENPSQEKEEQTLYQNIVSYIEMHLEDELSLDTLACEFFVSKFHISHVFKEKFGISVHQFILKKRLAMSQQAILANTEISEVYLACGFKDYSSFFRAFRREYGISPREFREAHRHQPNLNI